MPSVNKPSHKLSIVGIGPGNRKHMTFQAAKVVQDADYVVGYKPYLELIEDLLENKQVISSSMGKEVDRAKTAVDLLDDGSVALVSSGDPNIYGMAGLGLELASAKEDIGGIKVVPGVTSFAAAACRAGIVFRESVAVISLSDLLTPWSCIEERLKLAAEYRMPVAIYNPRSRRRDWHRLAGPHGPRGCIGEPCPQTGGGPCRKTHPMARPAGRRRVGRDRGAAPRLSYSRRCPAWT